MYGSGVAGSGSDGGGEGDDDRQQGELEAVKR